MLNRRQVLAGSVAAGTAMVQSSAKAKSDQAAGAKGMVQSLPPVVAGTRLNLSHTQRTLATLGIDGLIMSSATNFRQATGHQPVVSKMGYPATNLALVTGGKAPAVSALMQAFSYYYLSSDTGLAQDIPVLLYGPDDGDGSTSLADAVRFADRGDQPLSERELSRVKSTKAAINAQGSAADMVQGLAKLLRQNDLLTGTLALDDFALAGAINAAAPDLKVVSADNALRRIRPVKSALEISLMRQASKINIDAAKACLGAAAAGASYRQLRHTFFAEAARRGARGVFMVIDHVSDEQHDRTFTANQSFLIDCVCEYEGYHGDYGRTVFLGEPTSAVLAAARAAGAAWDQLRQELKPGLTFSQIRKMGQQAMAQNNGIYPIPFNPHSVGLMHSDHMGDGSSGPREDIALEPGMIISVDCPVLAAGMGGSVHLEDLTLITADGSEPIHEVGPPMIEVY